MADDKLIPLSRLVSKTKRMDSVAECGVRGGAAIDVLWRARQCWDNLSRFRADRERNKRYVYGDQWGDYVYTKDGKVREEDYIRSQGSVPLKNNLIRRLVRNVVGVFRGQNKEPTCTARDRDEQRLGETMSVVLQYNWQLNRMADINARTFEEFLLSGFIVHKKSFGWRTGRSDCWTDYVHPDNFFIDNAMRDFRGWDVSMLGELHDVAFSELCGKFVHDARDFARMREIYSSAADRDALSGFVNQFGYSDTRTLDFFTPSDPSLCRVIEVWTKEYKPRYRCHDYLNGDYYKIDEDDYADMVLRVNAERVAKGMAEGIPREEIPLIVTEWFIDNYWYFRFLSPFGDVLQEGETPYAHGSHPYVFKMYPFIDGEVHSFVEDIIDQQRYVNRLIMLYDWIMRSSAKGVLLFPEDCLADGMKIEDVAEEWARFDGVIAIRAKPGVELPRQVATNATNIGISDLLQIQLKFFEDISGVHGALQGKQGYSGQSASLYAQQTANATNSLLDLLDTFSTFVVDAAYKDVKNIQQFYDSKKIVNIAGHHGAHAEYDPRKIRDVDFDLSIAESTSTPAYRQVANDFLMQIWQAGQITLEQLLRHGDFHFADDLLQDINATKEQMLSSPQTQAAANNHPPRA